MLRAFGQDHRLGQTSLLVQPKIGLLSEFAHAPLGEELGRDTFSRRFISDVLRAFFAEFEVGSLAVRFGPCTSRTIDPLSLIELQQCPRAAHETHFAPGKSCRRECGRHAARGFADSFNSGRGGFERRLGGSLNAHFGMIRVSRLFDLLSHDFDSKKGQQIFKAGCVRGAGV